MLDTVIAHINALGSDQPEQLTFTDHQGRLISDSNEAATPNMDVDADPIYEDEDDDNVELPGVDLVTVPGVDPVELPGVDGTNT